MDAKARDRLLNLLARTTSEHDGEALAAARKANQLLGRHHLSWAEVISDRRSDPAARSRPPTGDPMRATRSAGPSNHMSWDGGVGNASHNSRPQYPPTQHWYLTSPQRIARACLWYGLGVGLLIGAAIMLFTAIGDDGFDPSDYALSGVGFALPALVGFLLWVLLGGWLPRQRTPPGRRSYRRGRID